MKMIAEIAQREENFIRPDSGRQREKHAATFLPNGITTSGQWAGRPCTRTHLHSHVAAEGSVAMPEMSCNHASALSGRPGLSRAGAGSN